MSTYIESDIKIADSQWKDLYRFGGVAPLLTVVFYLSEFIFIRWDQFPDSMEDWFALFQRSKLLGLFYLNALDIISIALLGVMFLALFEALKQANPSWMTVAAFFGLLGVGIFIVPRVEMVSMMTLSDLYATAGEVERARLLTAGVTLGALSPATPLTVGFLFMSVAVLVISIVMLREGHLFHKVIPWLGIFASLFTFVDHFSLIIAPRLATPLMIASGLFWIPWWIMVGLGLLRRARLIRRQAPEVV